MQIKLSKPITVGDKTVEEVSLVGLESLTGADIELSVREASAAKGEMVFAYEVDIEFHAQVAMKLTGLGRDALRALPARDYRKVMSPIRSFFLDSD